MEPSGMKNTDIEDLEYIIDEQDRYILSLKDAIRKLHEVIRYLNEEVRELSKE
jgi:asparagine synthetase A|tara:strand:+ start:572 stop:730 length:159 start_codon:yes stop_codon:yes gene_type:complete